jgi:sugar O-acyltransferase (sialic acid O-acetyltransferase NeuD family)
LQVKRLGIFGTSGFAREVGDIAYELSYLPLYIARDEAELALWDSPAEAILETQAVQYADIPFAIGVGDRSIRQRLAARYSSLEFMNLVHPSATFGHGQRETLFKRRGIIVAAGARLTNNIDVGNFAVFDRNAMVGHDCIIEDFVHLAPAACVSGNVHIETACWIGATAVINQGTFTKKLLIGSGTVIGSGAVVTGACDSNAVYVGAPAKRIK